MYHLTVRRHTLGGKCEFAFSIYKYRFVTTSPHFVGHSPLCGSSLKGDWFFNFNKMLNYRILQNTSTNVVANLVVLIERILRSQ